MALPPALHTLARRLMFDLGALAYDGLTGQPIWREQVLRLLDHVEPSARPVAALDLGTGPGVSAFALAEALPGGSAVTGVDLSPRMIARAKRHHARRFPHLEGVSFHVADAARLPFDDGAFDLVTGHSFLYLLPDAVSALREARRVLRPGGVAVFMEPAAGGALLTALRRAPSPAAVVRRDPVGAARFAASMALWRAASALHGRMDSDRATRLFGEVGLIDAAIRPTLGGLGVHCVARRPAQST